MLKTFPASTPEHQGMNSLVLDSMMHFIRNTNQNIHHVTIIRNKQTVLDADIYPYTSKYTHDVASVTKSVVSLLIGIAIDKGFIKDENEPVLRFFPEINVSNQQLSFLTIKDLLTMLSGFDCNINEGEKALRDMRKTNDWVNFIFNMPMTSKPGDSFSYCSNNFYLLGEIIFRSTKLTPHDFAKKYLFRELKIKNTKWLANNKGIHHGWGDLFLHPTDMAKIGQLVLDKGKWQRKQVVSEQWITKSLKTVSTLQDEKGYGYGWWIHEQLGGYSEAIGRGEQIIAVIPSKNLVVIMLGGQFDQAMIGKYIFDAMESDQALSNNADNYRKLKTTIKEIASAPSFEAATTNQNLIRKLDKRTIVFEENITEIDSLQFDFISKERGNVTFYKKGTKEKYPFLLSENNYAIGLDTTLQLPVALKATLRNENEFVLHFNQLCKINNLYFYFTLNGAVITTTLEETSNYIKINITSSFN